MGDWNAVVSKGEDDNTVGKFGLEVRMFKSPNNITLLWLGIFSKTLSSLKKNYPRY